MHVYACVPVTFTVRCLPPDHSRGFGGKFGVQKDRVDKVGAN